MNSRLREPWIDVLRGLASLAIVLFHLNEVREVPPDVYSSATSRLWLGVPVFFVISGYCVMASNLNRPDALLFVLRRLVRVFLPYWASITVVFAVIAVRILVNGVNDVAVLPHSLQEWLATALLLTEPVTGIGTINWVYWTLSYEIAFYIMMAIALIWARLFMPLMIALTAFSLCLPDVPLGDFRPLFFLDYWPLFALGAGVASLRRTQSVQARAMTLVAATAMLTAASLELAIVGLLTAGFILAARTRVSALHNPSGNALKFLGGISYSLYLIHVPVGVYLLGPFINLGSETGLPSRIVVDVFVTSCCIAFAYFFYLFAERPALQLSRRLSTPAQRALLSTEKNLAP